MGFRIFLAIIGLFTILNPLIAEDPTVERVVSKVVERARENAESDDPVGYNQKLVVKKFRNGKLNEEETRTYRTIWIHDRPFSELVQINGKDLDSKQRAAEFKRKAEFIKDIYHPSKPDGIREELAEVRWWDIYKKYDFEFLPTDGTSEYLLRFEPKKEKLMEENHVEKILNHLQGKIWVDDEYNVLKAETSLDNPVKFAWGLAKLDEMEAVFSQQKHASMCLPSALHVQFRLRAGIFRQEHQEITANWYDIFFKPNENGSALTNEFSRK
jgi:hypothetical protein